jgi:hypothetical protein
MLRLLTSGYDTMNWEWIDFLDEMSLSFIDQKAARPECPTTGPCRFIEST